MALYTYDLDQVSLIVANFPIRGGFGEGGSISIVRNSELFTNMVGRRGDVVRAKNYDKSATVEVTLLSPSEANSTLNALVQLDENAPNGAGVGVFICRDRSNGDEYYAEKCWIQKVPDVEFGQEASDRVWTIFCESLEYFPGGRA